MKLGVEYFYTMIDHLGDLTTVADSVRLVVSKRVCCDLIDSLLCVWLTAGREGRVRAPAEGDGEAVQPDHHQDLPGGGRRPGRHAGRSVSPFDFTHYLSYYFFVCSKSFDTCRLCSAYYATVTSHTLVVVLCRYAGRYARRRRCRHWRRQLRTHHRGGRLIPIRTAALRAHVMASLWRHKPDNRPSTRFG